MDNLYDFRRNPFLNSVFNLNVKPYSAMHRFHQSLSSEGCCEKRGLHHCHSCKSWTRMSPRVHLRQAAWGPARGVAGAVSVGGPAALDMLTATTCQSGAKSSGASQARTQSPLLLENAGRTEFSLMENKTSQGLSGRRRMASALAAAAPSSFRGLSVCAFYRHNSVIY